MAKVMEDKRGTAPRSEQAAIRASSRDAITGLSELSLRASEPPESYGEPPAALDERMEVLGRLAGGIAHDFNNLLGVILNYAAFVAEALAVVAQSPPDCAERCRDALRDVGQIQRAAERATALTHQLLASARREVIQPQVLNLNITVCGVEELLRRTLGEDKELCLALADTLGPILADPGQMEQVLVNLAVNASDVVPTGGTLCIDTAQQTVVADSVAGGPPAKPGHYVRLRVSDTGAGMSDDVLSHAFDPFSTTTGAGTGLGLATVYGIVTEADGTIAVTSEPGVGTTFTIMLPVTDETASIDEPVPDERTPNGTTVLVVEDEEALRDVMERIFTRNGYRVLTAPAGAEAIALVAGHDGDIDLLVTDVVTPTMLGSEVVERLRQLRPDLEVLFMSGCAQPALASKRRLEPGVALVEKPFSEAALLAKAGQALSGNVRGNQTIGGA